MFKEVAEVITGTTPATKEPDNYGGEIPFVTPVELNCDTPIVSSTSTLSEKGATRSRILQEGSVLVCCIGSIGKVGIAGKQLATNQQINALAFDQEKVFPRYGYRFCQTIKPMLVHMAPSTTVPIVNKTRFQEIKILLPPLEEQKRIAAILDKADAIRKKRKQAIELTEQFLRSAFLDMFGDPITNPKGWVLSTIDSVAEQVTDGEHLTPNRTSEGIKLLSARNIRDGYIDFENVDHIGIEEHERIKRRCNPSRGNILLSCSGTIGRVASVETDEPFSLVRSAALVRPKKSLIAYKFLEHYLRTPALKARMMQRANFSSQANLFQNQIRELPVFLPPLPLQHGFSRRTVSVEKLKTSHQVSLFEFDAMFASLQQHAFRGEL